MKKSELEILVNELKQDKDNCDNNLLEIVSYLNSSKFRCGDELDGYVNINDILSRIQLVRDELYKINQ